MSQSLLNNNPTWAAQKKDKVLISILQKQTHFSGEITLQQRALYFEPWWVPAAPAALAWEAQLCWMGRSGTRPTETLQGQITRGIPHSHSKNQETQTKLVCNLISEDAYSPMITFTLTTFSIN